MMAFAPPRQFAEVSPATFSILLPAPPIGHHQGVPALFCGIGRESKSRARRISFPVAYMYITSFLAWARSDTQLSSAPSYSGTSSQHTCAYKSG